MDTSPETFQIVLQVINSVGTVGVLFLFVWQFMSGQIWPHKHVEELNKKITESNSALADKITDGIESAVTKGIVLAIHEIRKSNGGANQQVGQVQAEVLAILKAMQDNK